MTKRKRHVLIWLGSLTAILLIIVAAAVIFIATLDWNRAKPYMISAASKATGRELAIDGDLRVDFGWISRFHASEIKFQNAAWGQRPHMAVGNAKNGRLEFQHAR
jgi:AsmA family protein